MTVTEFKTCLSPACSACEEIKRLRAELPVLAERAYTKGYAAAVGYPDDLARQVADLNELAPTPDEEKT